jgi:hypothetical protein
LKTREANEKCANGTGRSQQDIVNEEPGYEWYNYAEGCKDTTT